MSEEKTTNLRMPEPLHARVKRVSDETHISMNDIIVLSIEATLDLVDELGPDKPNLPKIVELARAARRHARSSSDMTSFLQGEAARWEHGRDEILRLAESPDVSPEFRKVLKQFDETVRKVRYELPRLKARQKKKDK